MDTIKAFVGHSFSDKDRGVVRIFLDYFDSLKDPLNFEWDHAEKGEAVAISEKVKKKIEGKNIFIGILTQKGMKISPEILKRSKFRKRSYLLDNELRAGASEWIIQESGYGLAKCGRILFLVENGVDFATGLQGDAEYITFERKQPELCFKKFNEIIGSLLSTDHKTTTLEEERIPPLKSISEKGSVEEQISPEKSEKNDLVTDYSILYRLIIEEVNFAKAETELKGLLEKYKDNEIYNSIYWNTTFHRLKCFTSEDQGFKGLEKLVDSYPNEPFPLQGLALSYHHFENYSEAAAQYLKASKRAGNPDGKTKLICSAAQEYANNGDFKRAYDIINSEFKDSSLSKTQMRLLYKALVKISELDNNDLLFTCFSEKTLEIIPTDSDIRFSLAYKYSEIKDHELALYHYKILCDSKPEGVSWNNMGVEYRELSMKNKSINAYKKAAFDFNETLAMANLSNQYIKQGFFDDARTLLIQAREQTDYHQNIDIHASKINEQVNFENDSEEQSLQSIKRVQTFRQNFAGAYILPLLSTIDGKWRTKHGDIDITTQADQVTGILEILPDEPEPHPQNALEPQTNVAINLLAQLRPTKTTISLSGVIHNRTITYNIEKVIGPRTTVLTSSPFKFEGLMIISDDSLSMELMEREEEKSFEFYTATKIELEE